MKEKNQKSVKDDIIEEYERILLKAPSGNFKCGLCEQCGKEEIVKKIDGEMLCPECIERM